MSRIILLLGLAFLMSPLPGWAGMEREQPRIQGGTLVLKKAEIMAEPITLDGAWHFTFLGKKGLIDVPGSWTRDGYPRFGEGTYELALEFDEEMDSLALRSDHFATEYRVLANGRLIIGPERFTANVNNVLAIHPDVIELPIHGKKLQLTIVVSNHLDQIAGIIRPIRLGTKHAVLNDLYSRKTLLVPIVSTFSLLLLYFLLVATRKDHRVLSLILSGCCLCTLVFFAVQYVFFNNVVAPWTTYIRFFDFGWIGAAYFFGLYSSRVFKWNLPSWYTHGFQHLPVLIYFITLIIPIQLRSQAIAAMHLQILVSVIVNFVMTLGSVRKKADGASSFLVMSIMLLIAACNDILFAFGLVQSTYLFGFVFIVYLMAQGLFLARRHSTLLVESANAQLLKSQIVLSQKISGNAEPLAVQHPALQWSCVFQPADDAGGDWVYCKQYGSRLYFFLADVTDHGYHSALLTMVLSSAVIAVLDAQNDAASDPAKTLETCAVAANQAVNRVGPSLNKLSTMSLHCLDLDLGLISFIQAGHMPTLVSSDSRLKVLSNSHGLLGVTPDQRFTCKTHQLERGDKVFAYTDGLIENTARAGKGILKQKKLTEILIHARNPDEIQRTLEPFILGTQGKDSDDTAFIAVQWRG